MERRQFICPEPILPTRFSLWVVAPFLSLILLGAFLEFVLDIPVATSVAALIVIAVAMLLGQFLVSQKLSQFPCPKCGATSLEQSEDDENILLICQACQIEWVTNLTMGSSDTEYTDL